MYLLWCLLQLLLFCQWFQLCYTETAHLSLPFLLDFSSSISRFGRGLRSRLVIRTFSPGASLLDCRLYLLLLLHRSVVLHKKSRRYSTTAAASSPLLKCPVPMTLGVVLSWEPPEPLGHLSQCLLCLFWSPRFHFRLSQLLKLQAQVPTSPQL